MKTPASKPMSKSMKFVIAGVFCLLILAVGGLIFFNAYVYAGYQLGGLSKQEYQKALDIAAKDFCRADNLTFEGFDLSKFEEVLHGGDTYAWGAARTKDTEGRTVYVWIYLEWGKIRQQWLRNYCRILAPPTDELFYDRTHPGQVDRVRFAVSQIITDIARNFRVVFGDTSAS
ncbi:hypothetical protein [Desulfovibrio inopinatus]|uniref:hypothetical protein n=1 Tax=Desulfovibrio inopinatus TaxID=102109 RepID=UPI0003FA7B72|nr:hypothetical protein [Desulfovibrio inopinatus]